MSENDGVIKLRSAKIDEDDVKMIPVFELDDDVYYMPEKVSAGIGLKFLKIQAENSQDAAIYYMMVEMLGEEAYDALMDHPALEKEDLEQITDLVVSHALGGLEGKSSVQRRRKRSKK